MKYEGNKVMWPTNISVTDSLKVSVFWVDPAFALLCRYRRFGIAYSIYFQAC